MSRGDVKAGAREIHGTAAAIGRRGDRPGEGTSPVAGSRGARSGAATGGRGDPPSAEWGDARDAAVHGPPERETGGGMDRRAFLSQLALLGAAAASFRCAEPREPGLDLRPPLPPEAPAPFTPAQLATLAEACERILPGGEGIPGAADAGVIDFAAAELRRPELGEIRKRIDGGLLALDRRSARAFAGKRFADLGADEQDRILRETQVGSLQGEEFLRILISLTLEGFLGDPAYGGNRGAVGWKVTGAAPTSERGRLGSALEDRAAAHAETIGRASAAEASR